MRRRWCSIAKKQDKVRKQRVGTVKNSKAAITSRWLFRKASHWLALLPSGVRFRCCRKRDTVDSEISKRSSSSSPCVRGAPHVGFSVFMRRTKTRASSATFGHPTRCRRDFHNPEQAIKSATATASIGSRCRTITNVLMYAQCIRRIVIINPMPIALACLRCS